MQVQTARGADVGIEDVLAATRTLLWIKTAAEASAVARELVAALGGATAPAALAGEDALPVDLSFGEGELLLATAPATGVARLLLERHLPMFVLDAHRAIELAERASRLAEAASIDPLTGLPNRRMLGRALGRLCAGAHLIMVDLDHFKTVNDTLGHAEGDAVLRALGHTLVASVRAVDHVARFGGEEFVVVLPEGGDPEVFLRRLTAAWEAHRPQPVTLSAGIATVRADPNRALEAADRAMYRAKAKGRNQWQWATVQDYQ